MLSFDIQELLHLFILKVNTDSKVKSYLQPGQMGFFLM